MTDLVEAVLKRDLASLKELLQNPERNVDETDQYGDTALMAAASSDQEETLQFLLEQKANPNHQNKGGSTALHKAAVKNYLPICRLLVKNNADPQLKNSSGLSPHDMTSSVRLKEFLLGDSCVQINVPVPTFKHPLIIGKQGKMLKEIKEKSGVILISVPPQGSNDMAIVVKGTKESVQKAKELILATARKSSGNSNNFMGNSGMTETSKSDDVTTVTFNLAADKHKFLIGKGGQVLRELQDEFSVQIKIPQPSSGDEAIQVWGKTSDVDAAMVKIFTLTKPQQGGGRGRGRGGAGGGRGGAGGRGGPGGRGGAGGRGGRGGGGGRGGASGRGQGNSDAQENGLQSNTIGGLEVSKSAKKNMKRNEKKKKTEEGEDASEQDTTTTTTTTTTPPTSDEVSEN